MEYRTPPTQLVLSTDSLLYFIRVYGRIPLDVNSTGFFSSVYSYCKVRHVKPLDWILYTVRGEVANGDARYKSNSTIGESQTEDGAGQEWRITECQIEDKRETEFAGRLPNREIDGLGSRISGPSDSSTA